MQQRGKRQRGNAGTCEGAYFDMEQWNKCYASQESKRSCGNLLSDNATSHRSES